MKNRNLKLFYTHEFLFQLCNGILLIALPVFIYQNFHSVSVVFLFVIAWNLVHAILFLPILNLAMKLKQPKYFMAIGMLFYVASSVLFSVMPKGNWLWFSLGTLAFSLYISFYFTLRHWFFSVNTDYKKLGKQVSLMTIIGILFSFIGPILGGWLSFFISFDSAFLANALFGILSIVPILFFNAPAHPEYFGWKEVKALLKNPEYKSQRTGFFFEGFSHHLVAWPWVLVYTLFIGNILNLGLLVGISALIGAVLTAWAGHWFDRYSRKKLLARITHTRVVTTMLYTTTLVWASPYFIYLIQSLNTFTRDVHQNIIFSYMYALGNKVHPLHFVLKREVYLILSRIASAGMLAIVFLFLPEEFLWVSIVVGALALLGVKKLGDSDGLLG